MRLFTNKKITKFKIATILCLFLYSCEFNKTDKQISHQDMLLGTSIEGSFKCSINFSESVFPYMHNIDSMRNTRTGKFKPLQIHLGKEKNIETKSSRFLLEHGGFLGEYSISISNDSLNLENDGVIYTIGIFKDEYENKIKTQDSIITRKQGFFSFMDYTVGLDRITYDSTCKDSIYQFNYHYSPPSGVPKELHRDFEFINIFISKKRGILKARLKERETQDIWEAKYFGSIND